MSEPEVRGGVGPWLGVVLVSLCALLAGLLESLLTPLYAGGHLVPIAVLLAVVSNIVFPRMSRTFVPTLGGTALPFVAWLVVLVGFGILARPEGDVILPGGSVQWVSYGVMLGGALAGVVTVVASAPVRPKEVRPRDERPAETRPGKARPTRGR